MIRSKLVLHAIGFFKANLGDENNKNMIYSQVRLILECQSNHLFPPNTIFVSISSPLR